MRTIPVSSRLRLLGLALVGVLALTGCATDQAADSPDATTATALNQADIAFLQGMIPHHSQAIEMAQLVPDRAAHPELKQLAEKIVDDQSREIDTMTRLLAGAGAESATEGMDGMGHGGMSMPGMMDERQMSELRSLQGEQFDLRFIEMMSAHHRGAIERAEDVLRQGDNPQVADLARQIIEAQRAEIERMAAWQQEWGG